MRVSGLIAVTLVIAACSGDDPTPPQTPAVVEVSIVPATTMTSIGDTRSATAVVRTANGTVIQGSSVSWTSSNTAVATVNPATGAGTTVTAVGNGFTNITGRIGNVSDVEVVTVAQAFAKLTVAPATATINKSAPGNTVQLTATPQDARNNNITGLPPATFSSSNQNAATVNTSSGLVTAVDVGTATITASLTAGTVTQTGTSAITVQTNPGQQNVNVATVGNTFDPVSVTVRVGDQVTWTFNAAHTVTFNAGPSPPANIGTAAAPVSSGSVARTFSAAGTYTYHCELHGTATTGMRGTVIVNP
ncbi:MAG: Ig-like domain-containing protein [Gemmatimonadaceae bacterium]